MPLQYSCTSDLYYTPELHYIHYIINGVSLVTLKVLDHLSLNQLIHLQTIGVKFYIFRYCVKIHPGLVHMGWESSN